MDEFPGLRAGAELTGARDACGFPGIREGYERASLFVWPGPAVHWGPDRRKHKKARPVFKIVYELVASGADMGALAGRGFFCDTYICHNKTRFEDNVFERAAP